MNRAPFSENDFPQRVNLNGFTHERIRSCSRRFPARDVITFDAAQHAL